MATIRFTAEIGEDQTIRPPEGVRLKPGKAEVIVNQASAAEEQSHEEHGTAPQVPEVAKELARFARQQKITGLPSDFALNHDHYIHGAPKGIDQP